MVFEIPPRVLVVGLGSSGLAAARLAAADGSEVWITDLRSEAELATELAPERLLWNLQLIETRLGRPRTARRGPRTIDLDLLFYHHEVRRTPALELPHPRYAERAFVLVPLVELAPAWTDPRTGLRMDELLRRGHRGSVRLAVPRTVT